MAVSIAFTLVLALNRAALIVVQFVQMPASPPSRLKVSFSDAKVHKTTILTGLEAGAHELRESHRDSLRVENYVLTRKVLFHYVPLCRKFGNPEARKDVTFVWAAVELSSALARVKSIETVTLAWNSTNVISWNPSSSLGSEYRCAKLRKAIAGNILLFSGFIYANTSAPATV